MLGKTSNPRTITSAAERVRLSLYAKITWWLANFTGQPFAEWPNSMHLRRRITAAEFAQECINRGALGVVREYERAVESLAREVARWLAGEEPRGLAFVAVCLVWGVPLDGWLLNPHCLTAEVFHGRASK